MEGKLTETDSVTVIAIAIQEIFCKVYTIDQHHPTFDS